ncbi:HD-GYP domain-containing protein [Gemmatimonadota bacterium]
MDKDVLLSSSGSELYNNLLHYIRAKTDAVGKGESVSLSDFIDIAQRLIEDVNSSSVLLQTAMGYYDPLDLAISHAANVAIYTLKMATDMGLSERELEDAVLAALLHDIGISRLPVYNSNEEDILRFEGTPDQALSVTDRELVQQHPQFGHDAIVIDDSRSEYVAEIILQHHEKADGSGYPKGLMEAEQHIPSRIISIIDAYEALIHPRPLRDAQIPPMGIDALKNQVMGVYSREMLKELIHSFSIYPVGHFIRLNDGSIGRVIDTHRNNPCRPVIELLFDLKGERIDPPRRLDLKKKQLLNVLECLPRFRTD